MAGNGRTTCENDTPSSLAAEDVAAEPFIARPEEIVSTAASFRPNNIIVFGDDGLDAYAKVNGTLLQVSKRSGNHNSDIVFGFTNEGLSKREVANRLDKLVNGEYIFGIGLQPRSWAPRSNIRNVSVEWIFNKWPQISYTCNDGLAIRVRLFVLRDSLFQQYFIENFADRERDLGFLTQDFGYAGNQRLTQERESQAFGDRNDPSSSQRIFTTHHAREGKILRLTVYSKGLTIAPHLPSGLMSENDLPDTSQQVFLYDLHIHSGGTNELTAVYRLQDLRTSYQVQDELFEFGYMSSDQFLREERIRYGHQSETADHQIRANITVIPDSKRCSSSEPEISEQCKSVLLRNLEHILSVCAVKIPPKTQISTRTTLFPENQRSLPRIEDTCLRHLKWAFEDADIRHGAWYQPDTLDEGTAPGTFRSSITSASLHNLKLFEFLQVFPKHMPTVVNYISMRTVSWLYWLLFNRHKKKFWFDKTMKYKIEFRNDLNFRRAKYIRVPKYKLTCLAILWLTLKTIEASVKIPGIRDALAAEDEFSLRDIEGAIDCLEIHRLKHEIIKSFAVDRTELPDSTDLPSELEKGYTNLNKDGNSTIGPEATQSQSKKPTVSSTLNFRNSTQASMDEIHNRSFILDNDSVMKHGPSSLENELKGQEILLLSRVANSNEDRTLFYTSDTLLLDAAQVGFFDDECGNLLEIWKKLVKMHLFPYIDGSAFTVCSLVSHYAFRLALQKYNQDCAWQRTEAVLCNSPEDHSFNIGNQILNNVTPSGFMASKTDSTFRVFSWNLLKELAPFQLSLTLLGENTKQPSPIIAWWGNLESEIGKSVTKEEPTSRLKSAAILLEKHRKKFQNEFIRHDNKNIVDGDRFSRDWLYDFPSFIRTTSLSYDRNTLSEWTNDLGIPFFKDAFEVWKPCPKISEMEPSEDDPKSHSLIGEILVADIPKRAGSCYRETVSSRKKGNHIEYFLASRRTPEEAKKRFIFLEYCLPINSLIVCLLCDQDPKERQRLAQFFERHSKATIFQEELLHYQGNIWESELHLSFYQLADQSEIDKTPRDAILSEDKQILPGSDPIAEKFIVRTGVGYRFVGDLFDRYWTCYLTARLFKTYGSKWITDNKFEHSSWISQEDGQDQRKVFELYLVEKILDVATESGNCIIDAIEKTSRESEILNDRNVYSTNFEESHTLSITLLRARQLLHKLNKNYKEVISTIEQWQRREKDRPVQPRWTRKDEQKYRSKIDYHDRRVRRNLTILKSQKGRIDSVLAYVESQTDTILSDFQLLTSHLQLEESKRSTRLSEDVRLFTYVTIVFLPLTFSSSLFSMAGPPSGYTVSTMVVTTCIALSITFVLVANMKFVDRHVRQKYWKLGQHTAQKMDIKSLTGPTDWKKKAQSFISIAKEGHQSEQKHTSWWLIWFWYICACEIPARNISKATVLMRQGSEISIPAKISRVLVGLISIPFWILIFSVQCVWTLVPVCRSILSDHSERGKAVEEIQFGPATKEEADAKVQQEKEQEKESKNRVDSMHARLEAEYVTFELLTNPTKTWAEIKSWVSTLLINVSTHKNDSKLPSSVTKAASNGAIPGFDDQPQKENEDLVAKGADVERGEECSSRETPKRSTKFLHRLLRRSGE